jgi:RNA:NAD 2'-phosphotransferase (TPT1/KptA family)
MQTTSKSDNVNNTETYISKFLLFVLRHNPGAARLLLDEEGFANIDKIVSYLIKVRHIKTNPEQIKEIVSKRMNKTLECKGGLVRAKSGHSIILSMKIPDGFEPCQEVPRNLYTYVDSALSFNIVKNGLFPVTAKCYLFTEEQLPKVFSNMFKAKVDCDKCKKENVIFYKDKNSNKYTASFVPSKSISLHM